MERPVLYTLTSGLHGEMAPDARQEPFIQGIEAALGVSFDCRGEDFSGYGQGDSPVKPANDGSGSTHAALEIIYVRTGGTEGMFLERVGEGLLSDGRRSRVKPGMTQGEDAAGNRAPDQQALLRPVLLLTSGQSNSLAASMEILSWLRQRGFAGEILHGSAGQIAARLRGERLPGAEKAAFAPGDAKKGSRGALEAGFAPGGGRSRLGGRDDEVVEVPEAYRHILDGKRFGVVGRPSDWLISSDVDYAVVRESLGAELVDIPIEELVREARGDAQAPGFPLKALNIPRYGRPISQGDWDGAMAIYGALKRLVARYRLDGLTLRCFDLLTALHNTGCLALAILNAEGTTATCEGDIPAMLSMAVARELTGRASFQVNLSRIEGDRLLFAHCTVPLSLVRDYCYDTHFESGIGVAIHGELPEGPVTLFKLSPDCRRMFRREARLVANGYGDALCRTQVVVEAPGAAEYFLRTPVGNHHILVPGKM